LSGRAHLRTSTASTKPLAIGLSHETADLVRRQARELVGNDPDHIRVILAPPVPQAERDGVVPRCPVPAVGAVTAEDRFELGKRVLDDAPRMGHLALARLSVDVAHAPHYPSQPRDAPVAAHLRQSHSFSRSNALFPSNWCPASKNAWSIRSPAPCAR